MTHGPSSAEWLLRAQAVIPGGVSSPVRAFKSVGGQPLFITSADGAYLLDADGKRYLDYVGSWGPLILGHAHPQVVEAIERAARDGTSFGFATAREVELAELIVEAMPHVQMLRFVNSGTEATMSALRVARGFTGRERVLKFSGCYHGHADSFLVEAGSGVATLGIPGSAGVPAAVAHDTLTVPFNDLALAQETMSHYGHTVAAIIVEPIACNVGLIPPQPGFLDGLRSLCDRYGALLIFDEVITGFRVGLGGAQALYNIRPDLTTLGKIIGGGLPVGAYGGRRDLMEKVAPLGPVYQAGTLSGNPLAMAAGLATLRAVAAPGFYERLHGVAERLVLGITTLLSRHGRPARAERIGSIFHLWFKAGQSTPPRNYEDMRGADPERFARFFTALIDRGVVIAPSAYEVGFVSAAHSQDHIAQTLEAMEHALSHS